MTLRRNSRQAMLLTGWPEDWFYRRTAVFFPERDCRWRVFGVVTHRRSRIYISRARNGRLQFCERFDA